VIDEVDMIGFGNKNYYLRRISRGTVVEAVVPALPTDKISSPLANTLYAVPISKNLKASGGGISARSMVNR